jgi:F-type H+-transporting ATPase subunit gamma
LLEAHPDAPAEAVVVLASNRGMCGGYNSAINRQAEHLCAELLEAGRAVELHLFGKRASGRIEHERLVVRDRRPLQETVPTIEDASAIADGFMDRYLLGELSGVQVVYMQFLSAGAQRPTVLRLLPAGQDEPWPDSLVSRRRIAPIAGEDRYDLLPDPETLFRRLVPLSVRVRLHQCLLDAQAGEHVARMTAMRLATENADRMIRTLTTQYNRARQGAITTELAEIMGGAEAME